MALINSIPASQIVQVNPSVLSASGSALELIGLFLSNSLYTASGFNYSRVPAGTVLSFAAAPAVSAYFGAASAEALAAADYFAGYTGAQQIPEGLLFGAYPQSAVGAYVRSGSLATMTLLQLQALSGSLTVVMDGYTHTITTISFSASASFSAAATAMQTAFAASNPQTGQVTATVGATSTGTASSGVNTITLASVVGLVSIGDSITGTGIAVGTTIANFGTGTGGNGTYILSQNTTGAVSGACPLTSSVLNVTAILSGTPAPGQVISGAGITVNTSILSQIAGTTGGVGQYRLSSTQAAVVASETITCTAPSITVSFDGVSSAFVIGSELTGSISTAVYATGTLSASLNLTSATGAVLSQGAAVSTPSTVMNTVLTQTQNFVTFTHLFDPDNGSGNTQKLAFAAWNALQDDGYLYVAWDTDVVPQNNANATTCLAFLCKQNGYVGTAPISSVDYSIAAYVCGAIASIDTAIQNGRTTLFARQFPGATPTVTNGTVASNLTANGYSFYGAYASRANNFVQFANGVTTGPFAWIDSYINQIWLNANLQQAILNGFQNTPSVPYNAAGYSLIEAWCQDPINAALNFGAIRTGVTLSAAQFAEVNQAAGQNIAPLLQTRGYYLQVSDASPTTRAARQSPPCNLWYCDGGAVQQITLDSIELQ